MKSLDKIKTKNRYLITLETLCIKPLHLDVIRFLLDAAQIKVFFLNLLLVRSEHRDHHLHEICLSFLRLSLFFLDRSLFCRNLC